MSLDKPQQRDGLLERELGDETLIYDTSGETMHVLNVTGQAIWRLCDGENSIQQIAQALADLFEIDAPADVECDVRMTIDELRQKRLVC